MSAYRQMTTVMNDQQCLVMALNKRFTTVESHATPQQLARYGSDKIRHGEVIVRKSQVKGFNDIGFAKTNGVFNFVVSDIDNHRYNQEWMDSLQQDYLIAKATKTMTDNECELAEQTRLPNGAIQLRYRVMA